MSFAAPLVLLALLALPVLGWLYAARQRERRRAADAFAAPALAPSHSPRRPGWRRHAPVAIAGLALAVLVVAAARPRTTVAVPVERASIMLVNDVSGSMLAADVQPDRLRAAQAAAERFLAGVPRQVNVGVIAFNQRPAVLQSPTKDRAAVRDALARLRASGGTATGDAVNGAVRALRASQSADAAGPRGRRAPAAIVLLSDGASTRGADPVAAARAAGRQGIRVYTVALGTAGGTIEVPRPGGAGGTELRRVPPDPATLRRMAQASGGEFFATPTAARLSQVYERLGSQLGRRDEHREITAGFAGAGALLLLAGAALSLRWFGRLI